MLSLIGVVEFVLVFFLGNRGGGGERLEWMFGAHYKVGKSV